MVLQRVLCVRSMILLSLSWRWLEGSVQPFVLWTDHMNLAYHRNAKHRNSWQARWPFFLGCFNFTLTYRPGLQNIKPDASCSLRTPPVQIPVLSCFLPVLWAQPPDRSRKTFEGHKHPIIAFSFPNQPILTFFDGATLPSQPVTQAWLGPFCSCSRTPSPLLLLVLGVPKGCHPVDLQPVSSIPVALSCI